MLKKTNKMRHFVHEEPRTSQHKLPTAELYKPANNLGWIILAVTKAKIAEISDYIPTDIEMERISKLVADGLATCYWDTLLTVLEEKVW